MTGMSEISSVGESPSETGGTDLLVGACWNALLFRSMCSDSNHVSANLYSSSVTSFRKVSHRSFQLGGTSSVLRYVTVLNLS